MTADRGQPIRVLVVEDERSAADMLTRAFVDEGFDVKACGTGARTLHLMRTWQPDVILLDLTLPDGDGKDLAREIRTISDVPLLMVTGRVEEHERIAGLDIGADDYVVKPFSVAELVSRVRAVLRRHQRTWASQRLAHGPIVMDLERRRVVTDGNEVELTKKEFAILRLLLERPGRVVRRAELAAQVWDETISEAGKTIDVHVSWLRQKLGDDAHEPRFIETVRGVGFRLKETD